MSRVTKNLTSLFILILIPTLYCYSQSSVSGKVLIDNTKPLKNASIKVLNFNNDKEIKVLGSDSAGLFKINRLLPGKYYLKITFVGYSEVHSGIFEIGNNKFTNINLGEFKMGSSNNVLNEVIITSPNKPIVQSEGKLTVNVSNSATATGISALEEVERLPGVVINRQNGAISLKGKEGAIIMINGVRTYMPNDALLQLLSSTTASKISKIELISNPSSSMDAEGNSGIINIVLKRNRTKGINGSLEGQTGFGKGSIYNFNGDISLTTNKVNSYLSYSFSRSSQDQVSFNSRNNTNNDQFSINTNSNRDPVQRNHNIKYGIDYQITDSSSFGGSVTYYDNKWSMDAINNSTVTPSPLYNTLITNTVEINHWKHIGGNLNFQSKISKYSSISVSFDYLYYKDDNPSNYITANYGQGNNFLFDAISNATKSTPIHIIVPQINYTIYSNKAFEIKTGVKASISDFENRADISELKSDNTYNRQIIDNSKLNEKIFAVYAESSYKISSVLTLKGGLRFEHTLFDLNRNGLSPNINKSYGNLFPSVTLSSQVNENNALSIYYNKRINRPTFNDIAPFVLYIDPYTVFTGNAAIQPSTTNNFGLDYNWGNLLFSAGYSYENNTLAKFQISVDPATNTEIIRPENLGTKTVQYLGMVIPFKFSENWLFQNSLSGSWQHLNTGRFENNRHLEQFGFQYTGTSTYTIKPKFLLELSGFYNSTSLSGTSVIRPFGGINFGLQKKLGSSTTIRVNVNDILNSIKSTALVNIPGYEIKNGYDFSQRTFKISCVYNFGHSTTNTLKERKTAEEEKKRVE